MKDSLRIVASLVAACIVGPQVSGAEGATLARLEWHGFPDAAKFGVRGLPWFAENSPKFWRMPGQAMESLPKGVQGRSKCPSGGRIVMRSTTSRLALRAAAVKTENVAKFDAYVDGRAFRSATVGKFGAETELMLFEGLGGKEKEIVVYLPHLQEVVVTAIGVDVDAQFRRPEPQYAQPLPVVFYGSSVCQGSGSSSPGQTYAAVVCRNLNLDFVNLGFGGAGKAEADVVELVMSVPACCYVFDLGKSYGAQDATAFKTMLQSIRRKRPEVPLIVLTPITSARELQDPAYSERSIHTRTVMRGPARDIMQAGDGRVFLVEGEDLLGFKEHDALSKDGVHPTERGYAIIAARLSPILNKALGL
jgi:hypothetical protein